MAYTEFCCRSGGSNLNAGTRTGSSTEPGTAANFTYASGNWVASTGVFTVASGNPQSDGVAVGDFASVYADGSTKTGFVGRVTARDATTITVSLTAKSGTAPTDGTANRTLKIGGAWAGPSGTDIFPFAFVATGCTNAAGELPRVNYKNDQTYAMTNAIDFGNSTNNYVAHYGYANSYGDSGRATFSWSAAAVGGYGFYQNVTFSVLSNIEAVSTATSGLDYGFIAGSASGIMRNCVARGWRLVGIYAGGLGQYIVDCEVYSCCNQLSDNRAGIYVDGHGHIERSIVHDCGSHGITVSGIINAHKTVKNCISESNSGRGLFFYNGASVIVENCDFYNNTLSGIYISTNSHAVIRSCNIVKNERYGVEYATATNTWIELSNNGFGAGSQANLLGSIESLTATNRLTEISSVTYPSNETPWNNPASGDFSIVLGAAKSAGYGTFVQTQGGYSGAVGYPDIGAAQGRGGGIRQVNIRGGADQ